MSEQSIFYESILNYQELVAVDPKLLKQIDRVFIHKDYWGTEIFFITKSDQVFGFGRNYKGRLGFGNTNEVKEPTIIPELCGKSVKNIKTSYYSFVALTQSGQIYTFDYNHEGATGNGDNSLYYKPNVIAINNQLITAIDCTYSRSYLLTQTGQLYWFGYSYIYHKDIKPLIPTKVIIPSDEKIKNISCGSDHILALTENGKVFAWGRNNFGQLGLSHNNDTDSPQLIDFRENLLIKQISCGYNHSIVLTTDGRIYSTGNNKWGQLGIGNKINQNIFQLVSTEQKEICCFENISMSLDINNKLYIWGESTVVSPVLSAIRSFQEVINTYAHNRCTLKPLSSVELFNNITVIPKETPKKDQEEENESILNYQELVPVDPKLLRQIDRVFIHKDNQGTEILLITKSDQVFGFGRNYKGRLGFGNTNEVKEPTIIPELCGKSVKNIKTSYYSFVALTQSGQIYTFDYNHEGATGNGDNSLYYKPNVIAINNQLITAIDCTYSRSYLLTQTGQLYWFGYSYIYHKALIPTKVIIPSDEKIKNICCGSDHILALTESGKVFAWGYNGSGQLGLSHNNFTETPKLIDFRENLLIKQISCGYNHSIVLTTDGRIYSTGCNSSGQLGIGNKINQNIFQLVSSKQKEICCFENISMSLDINNKLYIWGKIKAEVVSPVLSGIRSFQEVINTYADNRCSLKPLSSVELFKKKQGDSLIKTMSKLFNNPENSDLKFRVKCRGSDNQFKYIYGHKWFIKETSEYIKTMIDNQNNSNQTTGPTSTTPSTSTESTTFYRNCYEYETIEIAINEYSYEAFYQYIKSLYTDFIDSEDMEELLEILSITQNYSDFDKKDECVELIKSLTKLENVCSVFSGAIKFRSDILRDFAFEMMSKRIDELIETTDYKNLDPTYAKDFLTEYQLMQRKK